MCCQTGHALQGDAYENIAPAQVQKHLARLQAEKELAALEGLRGVFQDFPIAVLHLALQEASWEVDEATALLGTFQTERSTELAQIKKVLTHLLPMLESRTMRHSRADPSRFAKHLLKLWLWICRDFWKLAKLLQRRGQLKSLHSIPKTLTRTLQIIRPTNEKENAVKIRRNPRSGRRTVKRSIPASRRVKEARRR